MPKLKGVHHAIRSGMLAAEKIYAALKAGKPTARPARWGYDEGDAGRSEIWKDLRKVRNMRQAFQKGFVVGGRWPA